MPRVAGMNCVTRGDPFIPPVPITGNKCVSQTGESEQKPAKKRIKESADTR